MQQFAASTGCYCIRPCRDLLSKGSRKGEGGGSNHHIVLAIKVKIIVIMNEDNNHEDIRAKTSGVDLATPCFS